jgi:hypothetical protein
MHRHLHLMFQSLSQSCCFAAFTESPAHNPAQKRAANTAILLLHCLLVR